MADKKYSFHTDEQGRKFIKVIREVPKEEKNKPVLSTKKKVVSKKSKEKEE